MKTESSVMGEECVFKEKTQHGNLRPAKAERHGGPGGLGGGELIHINGPVREGSSPLYSDLQFPEHGHLCVPTDSS